MRPQELVDAVVKAYDVRGLVGEQIDADFATFQETIAHETGHYLGLNHPSESTGTYHDIVRDTPICTSTDPRFGVTTVDTCRLNDTNAHPVRGIAT